MNKSHYAAIVRVLAGDLATCETSGERRKVRAITLSLADVFAKDKHAQERAEINAGRRPAYARGYGRTQGSPENPSRVLITVRIYRPRTV